MAVTTRYELESVRSKFGANGFLSWNERDPDVTGLSGGRYAVVYASADTATSAVAPYVTFFSPGGTRIGEFSPGYSIPFAGTDADAALIGAPKILELANGNVAVVWDSGQGPVFGAILNPVTGAVVVPQFAVSEFASDTDPEMSLLANGNWLVTMTSGASINNQIMSPTGEMIGTAVSTGVLGGPNYDPVVTALNDGGWVTVYTNADPGGFTRLYAEIRNADGSVRVDDFAFGVTDTLNEDSQPAVATLRNGNWAVVYKDTGWFNGGITLQIFTAAGTAVGDLIQVDTAASPEEQPDITVLANGMIVVTWTHETTGSNRDIYARVFTASGVPVAINGSSNPFTITTSINDDTDAAIAHLFDGRFVTTWADSLDDSGTGTTSITGTILELVRIMNGDGADDVMTGSAIKDRMFGSGGNDRMSGGLGNDELFGGLGNDILRGQAGNDRLDGQFGSDRIFGGDGDDRIMGATGDDTLYGENGNDVVKGSFGNDVIYGGDGNDRLTGGANVDVLYGGAGSDAVSGGNGNDTLYGGKGIDALSGGSGNDRLFGGAGNDFLNGDAGNDTLVGGAGRDTFIFDSDGGRDVIRDFQNDVDTIEFTFGAENFAQLLTFATVSGGNTIIDFGNGNVLVIEGLTNINLLADDTLFSI
jgi:Ca2+-binding RTX toxin-like protein